VYAKFIGCNASLIHESLVMSAFNRLARPDQGPQTRLLRIEFIHDQESHNEAV
jgi:hypothetical protein